VPFAVTDPQVHALAVSPEGGRDRGLSDPDTALAALHDVGRKPERHPLRMRVAAQVGRPAASGQEHEQRGGAGRDDSRSYPASRAHVTI